MTDIGTDDVMPAQPSRGRQVLTFIRQQPLGAAGFVVVVVMVVAAVFADYLAPYDPIAVSLIDVLQPPSAEHLFGTDSLGRDIFTRVMYGARTALSIGFFSSFLACTLGALIGVGSAYFGGVVDQLIQRTCEVLLAIPIIVLALVMVPVLGRNVILGIDLNLIFAIAIAVTPNVVRVMRSAALSVTALPYVDAARASGLGHARIILRHICPNVMAPYLILLSAYIAQAILLEAALSFLGLGVTEPTPAWGLMLSGNASDFYREAPWMILFPGIAISVAVCGFSLFGDSLRDWLDPRFRM